MKCKLDQEEIYEYNISDLVDDIWFDLNAGNSVAVTVSREYVEDIFTELIKEIPDLKLRNVSIQDAEEYTHEYLIIIDQKRMELYVEYAYCTDTGRYVGYDANVVYVHVDCNPIIKEKVENDCVFVCNFTLEESFPLEDECKTCVYRELYFDMLMRGY